MKPSRAIASLDDESCRPHVSSVISKQFRGEEGNAMRFGKRIRRGAFCFGLAIFAGAGAAMMSAGSAPMAPTQGKLDSSELIVHEWGTFLGMKIGRAHV